MSKGLKPAYVDSSAFIAFLDKSDSHHKIFSLLFSEAKSLLTSSLVIVECHAWFLRRYDSQRALQFLNFIEILKPLKVVDFGHKDILEGQIFFRKYKDHDLTLADIHGILLIKKLKIKDCWSTDRHFRLSGVNLVID